MERNQSHFVSLFIMCDTVTCIGSPQKKTKKTQPVELLGNEKEGFYFATMFRQSRSDHQ
jgi:hypothetical protein